MTVPTGGNCHLVCHGYGLVPNLGTSLSVLKGSSRASVGVGICIPLGTLVWKTIREIGWSDAPDLDFEGCVSGSDTKIWGRGFSGEAEVSRSRTCIQAYYSKPLCLPLSNHLLLKTSKGYFCHCSFDSHLLGFLWGVNEIRYARNFV